MARAVRVRQHESAWPLVTLDEAPPAERPHVSAQAPDDKEPDEQLEDEAPPAERPHASAQAPDDKEPDEQLEDEAPPAERLHVSAQAPDDNEPDEQLEDEAPPAERPHVSAQAPDDKEPDEQLEDEAEQVDPGSRHVTAEFLESINEALSPRQTLPGFADPRLEHVNSIDLPPWFIDRCRQAYLSVPFDPSAGCRVLGITSASYGEGKTSVAIGTATAMAVDTNKPTLLMECDFAEPSLYRFLGIDRGRGLGEWLDSGVRLRIVRGAALVPNLYVIPSGSPQTEPARLLFDLVDREVLLGLRSCFGNVVIDLPPALTISYGSLAYALADHLLIVVRSGATVTDDLERIVGQIGRDRVSGIVVNGTDNRTPAWLRPLL